MIRAQFDASVDRLAEALQTDIGWIRQHTEYGEAARQWSAGRPSGRAPAALAGARRRRTLDRRARQRAGADRRDASLRHREPARRDTAAQHPHRQPCGRTCGRARLAGIAYWQRSIAVEQRQIAEQQRKRAEDTLAAATKTANSLVFDLAQRFRDATGVPAKLIKDILDRARALQEQLITSGQVTPELRSSQAEALIETNRRRSLAIGDTEGALAAAEQARQILADLLAGNPNNIDYQGDLSVS